MRWSMFCAVYLCSIHIVLLPHMRLGGQLEPHSCCCRRPLSGHDAHAASECLEADNTAVASDVVTSHYHVPMAVAVCTKSLKAAVRNWKFGLKYALRAQFLVCHRILSVRTINWEWVDDHVTAPLNGSSVFGIVHVITRNTHCANVANLSCAHMECFMFDSKRAELLSCSLVAHSDYSLLLLFGIAQLAKRNSGIHWACRLFMNRKSISLVLWSYSEVLVHNYTWNIGAVTRYTCNRHTYRSSFERLLESFIE